MLSSSNFNTELVVNVVARSWFARPLQTDHYSDIQNALFLSGILLKSQGVKACKVYEFHFNHELDIELIMSLSMNGE